MLVPVETDSAPAPNSDPVALAAQADLSRLYEVVVAPALLQVAEPPGLDLSGFIEPLVVAPAWPAEGWDGAAASVLAYSPAGWMLDTVRQALLAECHRGFALMLGATFERQVRAWLCVLSPSRAAEIEAALREPLWNIVRDLTTVDVAQLPLARVLEELWELVSAMRHGSGRAMRRLTVLAPHLWPWPGPTLNNRLPDPEISGDDLRRYYGATMAFWGRVGATPPMGVA